MVYYGTINELTNEINQLASQRNFFNHFFFCMKNVISITYPHNNPVREFSDQRI